MKLQNDQFTNYRAFHANFEDVYIYKYKRMYYIFKEPQKEITLDYFMFGTKDVIEGWLYGCVQTRCHFVTARAEILI